MGRGVFWDLATVSQACQRKALDLIRQTGLRTDEDVHRLIGWLKEPKIGTKVNCAFDGHTSPFRFVADVLTLRTLSYIAWANRGGSKSYLAGLITWVLSSHHPRLETTILGGSFEQSEKSYKAMNDFWNMTGLKPYYLKAEPTRQKTEWLNLSSASVLTASTKSARGPHPQRLIMDEIDEMEEDVYKAALSQPQSKYGLPASLGKLSTNHKRGGMMDIAIDKAKESGLPVYKWCIWECLKPCLDYSCSTCPLTSICPGKQMKEADGYYAVEDFIQKLYELNEISLSVEWFCNKVGTDNLIYGAMYDEVVHSHAGLPDFSPKKKAILSADWGGTEAFSIGVWQDFTKEGVGWVRVDEMYRANTTNQKLIQEAKTRPWWKNAKEMVGDPSRPDLITEWKEQGLSVYKADNEVEAGIESVRDALAPVLGKPKIFVNRRCKMWRFEVNSYEQKNGKPVKENDHAMDETRYFVRRYVKEAGQVRARRL